MEESRRNFIKTVGLSGVASALPLSGLLNSKKLNDNKEGFVINAEAQETYFIFGRQAPVTIIIDKKERGVKTVSLCIEDIKPGDMIPVHKHLNEAEIILIQHGSGIFTLGEKEFEVKEGSAAYVPPGDWHGLRNTGTGTLRMVFNFSPSGFEGYFREIGVPEGVVWEDKTPQQLAEIDHKYGIVYKR